MREDDDSGWRLDKKVPIALIGTIILTIIGQSFLFGWAASNLWTRVGELERQQLAAAPRFESVIRLEAKVDVINSTLQELKAMVNRRGP